MRSAALFHRFARTKLLEEVTPVQRLDRLERELGSAARIYVKRDDLMGLGAGGNKLRKRRGHAAIQAWFFSTASMP